MQESNLSYGLPKAANNCRESTQDLSAAIVTPVRLDDGTLTRITDLVIYSLVGDCTFHIGGPTGPTITASKLFAASKILSDLEITGGIWVTTAGSAGGLIGYLLLGR